MLQACDSTGRQLRTMPGRFGTTLRRVMSEQKVDLEDLAKDSGVSRSTIYRLLSNRNAPDFETIQKLSRGLEVPITKLTGDDETESLRPSVNTDTNAPGSQSSRVADTSLRRRQLDDYAVILAGLARAVVQLTDSIDHLAERLPNDKPREQAEGRGVPQTRRVTRRRETG